jgi:hypothetical protein
MRMRYQYVVILKKDSEKTIDFLSLLLCFFSALSFLFFAVGPLFIQNGPNARTWFLCMTAAILIIGPVINLITRRRTRGQVRYRYLLLVAAIGWISMTVLPWIAAFFFLLAFLEFQAKRPLEIGFHHDRVVINTLIKQSHDWVDFNNVVLKDGLLTLDYKNNRLLQKEVADDEDEDDADEEEFNAFCRQQLKKTT